MNLATDPPLPLTRRARRLAGRVLRSTPWVRRLLSASADYSVLDREKAFAAQQASGGWLRGMTAQRQQQAYDRLLAEMRDGSPRIDLRVAAEAVRMTEVEKPSILEVGCGGGYYSEVFATLLDGGFDYTGVDYSAAMVETARRAFPRVRFEVGDACSLEFPDASFDVVFNGVSLMHILDYERAIAESRRVARRYCLYHSVPVFADRRTTYLRKYAYGAPVVEVVFNRAELLSLFDGAGLELIRTWQSIPYDVHPATPEHSSCETYLLRVRD